MAALITAIALMLSIQHQQPLTIVQMWIETGDPWPAGQGTPRIEVLNTAQRAILAWHVRFVLKRRDGTTESVSGFGVDSASVLPEDRTAAVPPGRTVHNTGGGAAVSADAAMSEDSVTFVIFDDDTALGDEWEIALYFARRQTEQAFWQKMQTISDSATSHASDPGAVLSQIREGLEADSDPKFHEWVWYREILGRMSARRIDLAQATPESVLQNLRSTIAARKANADAHATRR